METFEPAVTFGDADTALVVWTALTESVMATGERATRAAIEGNTLGVALLSQRRVELQRVAEIVWDEYQRLRTVADAVEEATR